MLVDQLDLCTLVSLGTLGTRNCLICLIMRRNSETILFSMPQSRAQNVPLHREEPAGPTESEMTLQVSSFHIITGDPLQY